MIDAHVGLRIDRAGTGADGDLAFGAQVVASPPQPDLADIQYSRRQPQRLFGPVHQARVDRVMRYGRLMNMIRGEPTGT
jgi:hypothetical protein